MKFSRLLSFYSLYFACVATVFLLGTSAGCRPDGNDNDTESTVVTVDKSSEIPETYENPSVVEESPASEETEGILNSMDDSENIGSGENNENVDTHTEDEEFGTGEDWTLDNQDGIDQEELDKYINDDEYMFEHLKLDAPLFENASQLVRLHPEKPIWVDRERQHVVLQGWICQTRVMLEFFLCQGTGGVRTFPYEDETGQPAKMLMFNGTKCHESVISTEVSGRFIHTGLLAIGAKTGTPVEFSPEFKLPTGDEIEILVRWTAPDGSTVEHHAQDLVVDSDGNPMQAQWLFPGSFFYKDGEGNERYAADSEGEFISVSNFPSAILDIAQSSSNSNESLLYLANEKILPERGTPVTIILSRKESSTAL